MEGGDNVGGANNDVGGGASSGAAADPSTPSDGAASANRVARKMRTYFEMGTDGQRFVCLKSGISILRRYL